MGSGGAIYCIFPAGKVRMLSSKGPGKNQNRGPWMEALNAFLKAFGTPILYAISKFRFCFWDEQKNANLGDTAPGLVTARLLTATS